MELTALVDVEGVGAPISAMWPHLRGFCDRVIVAPDSKEAQAPSDVVFCATPDGVGQSVAKAELAAGRRLVDYSGDFRFRNVETYSEYARRIGRTQPHASPELLPKSVYGLTEFHRGDIAKAQIVGNPGCFAVSCIMGLMPAVKSRCIDLDGPVICDCKTGVSGAGKKPKPQFHYPERYDNSSAYRLTGHQHVMEIETELSAAAGRPVKVTFTPQVVPMTRGIISVLYGRLARGTGQARVEEAYREAYGKERFIRLRSMAEPGGTSEVRGSNLCDVAVACDDRTGTFRVITHIDNLMKGQAGSALQNANVMFGLDEGLGLSQPGSHP
jgi:N-acetyl-gamma-glutamyl-phosphate reductase